MCVYTIPYQECPLVYIGETIKSLKTRISQYRCEIQTSKTINANYEHKVYIKCKKKIKNCKFIFNSKNKKHLELIETDFITTSLLVKSKPTLQYPQIKKIMPFTSVSPAITCSQTSTDFGLACTIVE